MNNNSLVFLSILLLTGCGPEKITTKQTVVKFYNARNAGELVEAKRLISDSITVTEGDYVMPYSQDSYYEVLRWDSVFFTKYELVELQERGEQLIASIALSSIRNDFLKNERMICQYKISFSAGKITKIDSLDCEGADWKTWQKRVNALVSWIEVNHPELNGFIHDMTAEGANKYVKSIRLYEARNNDLE